MMPGETDQSWVDIVRDERAEASSSAVIWRLVVVPAIVVALFCGGFYWLRLQAGVRGAATEPNALMQVHLVPLSPPDPIPVAPAPQTAALGDATPTSAPTEQPAAAPSETLDAPPPDSVDEVEPAIPPARRPAISPGSDDPAILLFRDALLRHIARFPHYPKAAESKRLQGKVRAVFSVNRAGHVLGAWVKSSSGEIILDQEALDAIHRAQPLPAIPAGLPDPIRIEVTLGFDPP